MLTDIGKWAHPVISSHAVQWSLIPYVGHGVFLVPNKVQMWMPLETHAQQHYYAPDANFCNPIPHDSRLDMPVATEYAIGTILRLGVGPPQGH